MLVVSSSFEGYRGYTATVEGLVHAEVHSCCVAQFCVYGWDDVVDRCF